MKYSFSKLLDRCAVENAPIWRVILEWEHELTGASQSDILSRMDCRYEVMRHSAHEALGEPMDTAGELITGCAKMQYDYAGKTQGLCGGTINTLMALALSVSETNAAMGRVCACPTGGSGGIVPSVLCTL
ncbi:MAG: L-serine ammonia-lyase, iron-sulfur-dependent, subunit alpha, partial [Oscillospiraceae bacterium]|nr:L-serine ammonia-lyase, iron-sulfur-dependent, subunit alpha [Oscillospiraceae bacterium]